VGWCRSQKFSKNNVKTLNHHSVKKANHHFQNQYASDVRRYQEQHGDDATLDIILDAARHHDAGYLAFLAQHVGLDFTHDDRTALFWLAGTDDLAAVRLLIEHGASVQSVGKGAASPLMHAAHRNQLEVARLLVERGAKVDFEDKNGDSPLSCACEQGHEAMVFFLEKNRSTL
jgi:ankyrin repeat protein